jgi:protocatechuate 3,4-dioxygenase beta subunit
LKSRKVLGLFAICISLLGLQVAINDAAAATGTVTGTVFNDKNSNGANDGTDAGVSGVVVSAYDSSGAQVGTTTTSGNGTYSLNVSSAATNSVRIEFTTPNGYQPSFQGAANATSIQFVSVPATNVNYAVLVPGNFCSDNPGSSVAGICLRPGTVTLGTSTNLSSIASSDWKGNSTTLLTRNGDTGSLWGMAFDGPRQVIFASAALRRHSGLGPKGIAGIYATSRRTGGVIQSWDLSQAPFNLTFSANNSVFTDANRGLDDSRIESADLVGYQNIGKVGIGDIDMSPDGQWLFVTNLYEKKIHRIAVTDTNSDGVPELGAVTSYTIPVNTCSNSTSRPWGLTYRPQDNSLLIGVVCSNETQTPTLDPGAGTTSLPDPGVILKLVLTSSTFSTLSSVDFDYVRSAEIGSGGETTPGQTCLSNDPSLSTPTGTACLRARWHSWTDNFGVIETLPGSDLGYEGVFNHPVNNGLTIVNRLWWPQPIIADIEVTPSGHIVLGVMDRFGMQMGTNNRKPTYDAQNSNTHDLVTGYVAGDMLLLCPSGGSYIQNNADGCTPASADDPYMLSRAGLGGRQAYREVFDDNLSNGSHLEMTIGGLAFNPATNELGVSMMDAKNEIFTGGIRYLNGDQSSSTFGQYLTGTTFNGAAEALSAGNRQLWQVSFLKSMSMGDIEMLCDQAPVQIGNRVWIDTNGNGIQDPEETPVAGVTVRLYDTAGTTLLGTAVTNAQGQYYFSTNLTEAAAGNGDHLGGGLTAGQPYKIRLDKPEDYAAGGPLSGYQLTQATATSPATSLDTSVDSNATTVSNYPEIAVAAVFVGVNNHTYDVGFMQMPRVSVGNFVWIDSDADGIQDQGEPGLAGAVLTLTDMSGNPVTNVLGQVVGSQTTASNGAYLFENLPPGQYKVNITYPAGYQATTASAGSDRAVDSSTDTATSVNLPNNGDADVTLDFGVVVTPAPAPLVNPTTTTTTTTLPVQVRSVIKVSVGDFVWLDTDRDGVQDANEKGIAGVSLSIRNADGSLVYDVNGKLVSSTKTNKSGRYSFDNLPPGQYRVTVVDPAGYTATLAKSVSDAAVDSSLRSELSIVLSTDGQRDPSLDFGFYRPSSSERVEVGNYVWKDRNGNGLQGPGDTGIRGAILSITDSDGLPVRDVFNRLVRPQTTKNDGKYLFRNLPPGKYVVRIKYPDNYFPTTRDKKNRGLNSSTIKATSRNLKGGERDLTLDFGVVYRSGISGLPETR